MIVPDNQIIVIFGGRGDLAIRKIIPALFALHNQGLMPKGYAVLATGRNKITDDGYRKEVLNALKETMNGMEKGDTADFIASFYYTSMDPSIAGDYNSLTDRLEILMQSTGSRGNTLFYLSVPPMIYRVIARNLALQGFNNEGDGWKRMIIEKPFGHDYASSVSLNKALLEHWNESQVYRIDHYLGKETVQNILVTRFSNGIFEPLWNRNYVHHVEITSSESLGVEKRGAYYEGAGALRDMVQNHLLHLVGFIAMEPPSSIDSTSIRNELVKVFESLRPVKSEEAGTI
jgi:glucose-6-phosphate 1-dehydrogenase